MLWRAGSRHVQHERQIDVNSVKYGGNVGLPWKLLFVDDLVLDVDNLEENEGNVW